jgi:hypothetical protein
MATPKKGYWLDGVRIPGTTTILSRFKESGALIHWAWQLGMNGIDYREIRDNAANVGTCAHAMVEGFIRKTPIVATQYNDEIIAKASISFNAFLEWAETSQLKAAETEVQLISQKYRYGGTPDVFFIKGKRSLGDWKTSNAVYPEYLCQLAAYKNLWEENYPDQPIEGGAHLIRFDKEHGDFHHHFYTDLDDAWEAFKYMRSLYDLDKILKKRVA